MNLAFYIANRIRKGEISGKRLAGPVVKVATLGVALGMIVMILSGCHWVGFQKGGSRKGYWVWWSYSGDELRL